jgi:hypothetical protein
MDAQEDFVRESAALRDAIAADAHDVGVRSMRVLAARSEWIEQAAWAVAFCEDDLEDAIVELQKALNA